MGHSRTGTLPSGHGDIDLDDLYAILGTAARLTCGAPPNGWTGGQTAREPGACDEPAAVLLNAGGPISTPLCVPHYNEAETSRWFDTGMGALAALDKSGLWQIAVGGGPNLGTADLVECHRWGRDDGCRRWASGYLWVEPALGWQLCVARTFGSPVCAACLAHALAVTAPGRCRVTARLDDAGVWRTSAQLERGIALGGQDV